MATPPTVVEHTASSTWVTNGTPKTAASALAAVGGDLVVSFIGEESDNNDENFSWTDSLGAFTWTEGTSSNGSSGTDAFYQHCLGDAIEVGNATPSTARVAGSSGFWGAGWVQFRDHGGVGAIASTPGGGGIPALNLTTTEDNSAIVVFLVDWAAGDGSGRDWPTINGAEPVEVAYAHDSAAYTVYMAYYADAGAAGVKSFGLENPNSGDFQMRMIEVLGLAGEPPPLVPLEIEGGGFLLTESGVPLG
jgi:hypothetical protein